MIYHFTQDPDSFGIYTGVNVHVLYKYVAASHSVHLSSVVFPVFATYIAHFGLVPIHQKVHNFYINLLRHHIQYILLI